MERRPLLPASATGTVDTHSIVDPIRSHLDARCNYYEAECLNIDAKVPLVCSILQNVPHQLRHIGAGSCNRNALGRATHVSLVPSGEDSDMRLHEALQGSIRRGQKGPHLPDEV